MAIYPSNLNTYNNLRLAAGLSAMGTANYYGSKMGLSQRQTYRNPTRTMVYNTIKKEKRKRIRNSFKDKVLKTLPAKHYTAEAAFNTVHNIGYGAVPTQGIVQGDTNTNRDGDRINIQALKFRVTSHSDTAAAAYTYRVIIGWSGEEYTAAGLANSFIASNVVGAPQLTDVFLPNTFTLATTNGIVNPKAFTVIYDKMYDVNSQVSAAKDAFSFGDTVQIDTDFSYQSSGSIHGKTRNLIFFVMATVNNGVNGTTVTGDTAVAWDVIFKE